MHLEKYYFIKLGSFWGMDVIGFLCLNMKKSKNLLNIHQQPIFSAILNFFCTGSLYFVHCTIPSAYILKLGANLYINFALVLKKAFMNSNYSGLKATLSLDSSHETNFLVQDFPCSYIHSEALTHPDLCYGKETLHGHIISLGD